jgi:ATP-dependent Clp protease ATP-binding subunit ClpC
MRDKVMGELKQMFRPEFLNRIDATIVFHSLTQEQIARSSSLSSSGSASSLASRGSSLSSRRGDGPDRHPRLRPHLRWPPAPPDHPEPDRGPLAEGLLNNKYAVNSIIRVEVEDDLLKLVPVEELAALPT